jgi:uncharacterized protein YjiS (DUF1127 family)
MAKANTMHTLSANAPSAITISSSSTNTSTNTSTNNSNIGFHRPSNCPITIIRAQHNRSKLDNIFAPNEYDEYGYYKALHENTKTRKYKDQVSTHDIDDIGLYVLERLANGR